MDEDGHSDVKLRLIGRRDTDARRYNLPAVSEIAALVVGDFDESLGERDILVERQNGELKRINELNPCYLGLQYPLLFPYGEDRYKEDIPFSELKKSVCGGRQRVSIREFFAYRLQERDHETSMILRSRRLCQQFVVDAYTMVEYARLTYVRTHQKQLRCEMYKGLTDALLRGETDPRSQGLRVILPSTFTGGARYMIQNYQDAMAICRRAGYPDLFITFTCNPKWPEILRFVEKRNLKPEDRPDIVCRIFKLKLDFLIKDLRRNKVFGNVKAVIYTVEFQKRGLPNAHILLFLSKEDKYPTGNDIDRIISAEISDERSDLSYDAAVRDFMIHGPCGNARRNSPCMSNGRCTKRFPKKFVESTSIDEDGYPIYRRRDNGRMVLKNGFSLDNGFVVPHNRYLLLKYGAHMNVEWCNQSRSIIYLFKYVDKGHDRVTASFYRSTNDEELGRNIDEVNMYYDCRYISPCETIWRIFGFEIQYKDPPVERLSFHLPNEQNVFFSDSDPLDVVVDHPTANQSMFLAWMEGGKKYPKAQKLTYAEFPQKFVWKQSTREWLSRKKGFSLGRNFYVPPGYGDLHYVRCLLNINRGAKCHDDLKKVDEVQYSSYREACYVAGLLEDDREYIDGIVVASHWASAQSLRGLFVTLLSSDSLSRPEIVWEKCWTYLSDDILYKQWIMMQHQELVLSDDEIKNYALVDIQNLLQSRGKSLQEYNTMPVPDLRCCHSAQNRLIHDELRYNRNELSTEHNNMIQKLNDEQ